MYSFCNIYKLEQLLYKLDGYSLIILNTLYFYMIFTLVLMAFAIGIVHSADSNVILEAAVMAIFPYKKAHGDAELNPNLFKVLEIIPIA